MDSDVMNTLSIVGSAFIALGVSMRIAECPDGELPEYVRQAIGDEVALIYRAIACAPRLAAEFPEMYYDDFATKIAIPFGEAFADAAIQGSCMSADDVVAWARRHRPCGLDRVIAPGTVSIH